MSSGPRFNIRGAGMGEHILTKKNAFDGNPGPHRATHFRLSFNQNQPGPFATPSVTQLDDFANPGVSRARNDRFFHRKESYWKQ